MTTASYAFLPHIRALAVIIFKSVGYTTANAGSAPIKQSTHSIPLMTFCTLLETDHDLQLRMSY
ncbi:hypothetical protein [Symbiopectobacterium sp. RP]|uniref:hypothetical protein n=1 Tax=Symbiopectobacterium sp. RP TaxID=3248553 RepID=UPI003D268791